MKRFRILARVVVLFALIPVAGLAAPPSVLRLTGAVATAAGPFQVGEELKIQPAGFAPSRSYDVCIRETKFWPWVLVTWQGNNVWVNFDHVLSARRNAAREGKVE